MPDVFERAMKAARYLSSWECNLSRVMTSKDYRGGIDDLIPVIAKDIDDAAGITSLELHAKVLEDELKDLGGEIEAAQEFFQQAPELKDIPAGKRCIPEVVRIANARLQRALKAEGELDSMRTVCCTYHIDKRASTFKENEDLEREIEYLRNIIRSGIPKQGDPNARQN